MTATAHHPVLVCAAAYGCGAVPFSNVAARLRADVDLRDVGDGTVSGSALYRVAGFGPLVVAGVADVAKGAVGPLLAGPRRPGLAALSTAVAVTAHNWSPLLRGAGGRGISVAIGALAVRAWPGSAVLLTGLAAGRLAMDQAGLGGFVADVALVPVLWRTRGRAGALIGLAVVVPMLVKRIVGNRPPRRPSRTAYLHRLVFDRDPSPDGDECR